MFTNIAILTSFHSSRNHILESKQFMFPKSKVQGQTCVSISVTIQTPLLISSPLTYYIQFSLDHSSPKQFQDAPYPVRDVHQ